jgi:hypothetical protein
MQTVCARHGSCDAPFDFLGQVEGILGIARCESDQKGFIESISNLPCFVLNLS